LQHDLSILVATDLLTALGGTIPTSATAKAKHVKAIQQLTSILANQPAQRVDGTAPRLAESPPPRVATTSNNITSPSTIQQLPLIHQGQTCSNNPFQILADNDDDNDMTVVASNCSPRSSLPNLHPINLPVTPPKLQLASQTKRQLTIQPEIPLTIPTNMPTAAPTGPPTFIHDLRPTPSNNASHKTHPAVHHQLPIVKDDDAREEYPTNRPTTTPRQSTQLMSNRTPCNISRQALYHIISVGFTNVPLNTIPRSLAKHANKYSPVIDIEEYCCGVIHPVAKESITQYMKLTKEPLLKNLWTKAMSKELYRLAQRCPGITKGTNTIFYLSHAEILSIFKDRTVTYGCIVIDHQPQKEDPHCVRITVGGNLIKYPFELTTCTANMLLSKIMWNSVISTPDARFTGADIKNM
jgi:hypothetical protein